MQESTPSKGELRRQQIMHRLKQQGRITIQEIIDHFECSEATARRDIDMLEKTTGIIRTIGGALFDGFSPSKESTFTEKKQLLWNEKEAIAAKAAELVQEGDVIGLSGGTTTFLIARALKMRHGITVVTNAVNIAMELADSDGIQLVVIGGVMRSKSYELCGPLAERTIEHINIGIMFLGIDGLTIDKGITSFSELEAQTVRMLLGKSEKTIAVFDHTKIGKSSLFSIAPLTQLYAGITDANVDPSVVEQLEQHGVVIHIAKGTL